MSSRDLRGNLSFNAKRAKEAGSRYAPVNSGQEFTRDVDALFVKFAPLRKSIQHKLTMSVPSEADREDLISFINEQFVKLVKEYDPSSGVDFPGYITKMLTMRTKYLYVRPVNREHEREAQTTDEEILSALDETDIAMEEEGISDIIDHVASKLHLTEDDRAVMVLLSDGFQDKDIISRMVTKGIKQEEAKEYLETLKSSLAYALADYNAH